MENLIGALIKSACVVLFWCHNHHPSRILGKTEIQCLAKDFAKLRQAVCMKEQGYYSGTKKKEEEEEEEEEENKETVLPLPVICMV